jgi:hypothetical protein
MWPLQTDYGEVAGLVAQVDSATAVAETALENAAFVLTRVIVNRFKKTGNLARVGKVDFNKGEIAKMLTQELINKCAAIRAIGKTAVGEPATDNRGVKATRVPALSAAFTNFSKVMNTPRGQTVNHNALMREVETDIAALLDKVSGMDGLAGHFDGSDVGKRFIEAWKRAHTIMDFGLRTSCQRNAFVTV